MFRPSFRVLARTDLKASKLTLEHFLLRTRALALYRNYLRATRDIPNPEARWETIQWFRDDFVKNKHVTETQDIKDLLMQGHRFLRQMQGQMSLAGASHSDTGKLRGTRRLP
ncbi:hypothetical protein BCV70DRAFT_202618 [Testicularia cyperi]|uniref:LYR motif-containing protein 2 n=1 Tax=Testicularia cyperi TaxID=1882483 RepID=A0A317XHC1_9BASI|nr:hypothetical protein BCV70DRAFT_202618 [Testicularia cyperi]